jgi:hypothetical protein
MDKAKNILSEEIIIGFIEGKLHPDKMRYVENIISSNNEMFHKYIILKKSFSEIHNTNLEVTPDMLKDKLLNEFDLLDMVDTKNVNSKWFNFPIVNYIKTSLITPQLAGVISFSLMIVFLFTIFFDREQEGSSENLIENDHIQKLLKSLDAKSMQSLNKKTPKGISIQLKNDILVISQPMKIPRELYVFDIENNLILNDYFVEKEKSIKIETEKKQDSIRVLMQTNEILIFNDWIISD